MIDQKYVLDYVVEEKTDPKSGKVRKVAVYRGPLFSYVEGAETIKKMKRIYPLLSVAAAALFFGAMLSTSEATHSAFIMIPLTVICFPLIYLFAGCYRLLTTKEPMTREQSDLLRKRISITTAAITGLAGFSAVAHIVVRCTGSIGALDLLMLSETLAIFGCGLALFLLREKIETVESGSAGDRDAEDGGSV